MVSSHDVHEILDVDIVGIDSRRGTENGSNALLEHFESGQSLIFRGRDRELSQNLFRTGESDSRRKLLSALFQLAGLGAGDSGVETGVKTGVMRN